MAFQNFINDKVQDLVQDEMKDKVVELVEDTVKKAISGDGQKDEDKKDSGFNIGALTDLAGGNKDSGEGIAGMVKSVFK